MKILLTVHQFLPEYAAGTEVLTCSVACELIARGHEVHVLTAFPSQQQASDEQRFDEYDHDGIHVYRFHHAYTPMAGQTSMIEIGYDNRLAGAYFKKIVAAFKPDLVHFFHLNRLGTSLIELAAQAGVPAYLTPTDFWTICPTAQLVLCNGRLCAGPSFHAGNCIKHFAERTQKGLISKLAKWTPTPLAGALARLTKAGLLPRYPHDGEVKAISGRLSTNIGRLNQLRKIIAPNRFMAELLLRHGVLPSRIAQSSYGIDLPAEQFARIRRSSGQALRVGFIGTLAHYKGCHVLIESFKTLPTGRATLKIYGNTQAFPGYASDLQQKAGNHPFIEFCGVFLNSKISQVMAELDVLVVPSLWYENTPLVVYSAQAAGCLVLASNFPGISEVVQDEVNGLLFEAGHSEALAARLVRLCNEQGLLERLLARVDRPKSTVTYVDELLDFWMTA